MGLPRRALRGGLPVTRWLFLLLAACGAGRTTDVVEKTGPRSPRFVLRGECAPSTVGAPVAVVTFTSSCMRALASPTLLDSAEQLDGLFDVTCSDKPNIDFGLKRVLVVPARGAAEWFVFPSFVGERSDALEVGLVIRPQGSLPPDALVVLPRTPGTVELRWCRSVCVENCDVAIP